MGFGDLNEVLDKDDEFLSKSSLTQDDFGLLENDKFFEEMQKI
jgi:hypothetical protein